MLRSKLMFSAKLKEAPFKRDPDPDLGPTLNWGSLGISRTYRQPEMVTAKPPLQSGCNFKTATWGISPPRRGLRCNKITSERPSDHRRGFPREYRHIKTEPPLTRARQEQFSWKENVTGASVGILEKGRKCKFWVSYPFNDTQKDRYSIVCSFCSR